MDLSERARDFLRTAPCPAQRAPSVELGAGAADALAALRALEDALWQATGGRGLPAIGPVTFGPGEPVVVPGIDDQPMVHAGRCARRGPFFIGPEQALFRPSEGVFATSAAAEVERLVLLEARPLCPVHALLAGTTGERVAGLLDAPWVLEASDDACFTWASETFVVLERSEVVRVRAATLAELARALRACDEAGLSIELASDEPPVAVAVGRSERPFRGGTVVVRSRGGLGRTIRVDLGTDTIAERVGPDDAPFAEQRMVGGHVETRRFRDGLDTLVGELSAPTIARLSAEGVVRDLSRTGSAARLGGELLARGLEAPEPVLSAETRFGGLVLPNAGGAGLFPDLVFGTLLLLECPPAMRRNLRAVEAGAPFEPGGRFPQGRCGGAVLTLVGLELQEEQLFCDEAGVVYRVIPFVDFFEVESGSVKGFWEQWALRREVSKDLGEVAELRIDAEVGHQLAARLGLRREAEASDALVTHYRGADHWLWRRAGHGSSPAAAFAVTRTAGEMVEVARLAQELSPGASMSLARRRPGGPARWEALRRAGFSPRG